MDVYEMTGEFVGYNSASLRSNDPVSRAMARRMRQAGLTVERIEYPDAHGVLKVNLVGKKGKGTGGVALMGHSDVVPAEGWNSDPFKLEEKKGRLYGRGSADMKGSVACMIAAAGAFPLRTLKRPVYVVVTADEEIDCRGALETMHRSQTLRSSQVRYGVIGEPTVLDVVHAHKGSIKFQITARGRAAHSSTGKGINANHILIPFLNEMVKIGEDLRVNPAYQNADFTPPHATWNIVLSDGETASNITARESRATINCRPMPGQDWTPVIDRVKALAKEYRVSLKIPKSLSALSTPADSRIVREALKVTGKRKPKSVPYGTDGMVFGRQMELVVMGPGNIQQAHTTNEWIEKTQLEKGTDVFTRMVHRLCVEDPE